LDTDSELILVLEDPKHDRDSPVRMEAYGRPVVNGVLAESGLRWVDKHFLALNLIVRIKYLAI
jgi:hypothetical protein